MGLSKRNVDQKNQLVRPEAEDTNMKSLVSKLGLPMMESMSSPKEIHEKFIKIPEVNGPR